MSAVRRRPFVGAVAVLLVVAGWLTYRAVQIHTELAAARSEIGAVTTALRAGDVTRTRATAARASRHVDEAVGAADDPLWRAAGAVPVLGRSFTVVGGLARAAQTILDDVVPPSVRATELIGKRPLLTNGRVDLARLTVLRLPLEQAERAAARARDRLTTLPDRLVPGPIARQRHTFQRQVIQLASALHAAAAALQLAPDMLGQDGPRRYFLAVQNNAEVRGTGGIIGAYAVLLADRGRITRERVGTDQDFVSQERPVADLGQEYADHYDAQSGRTYWTAAVLTPDWPSASKVIAGLWEAQGGGQLDGVIGVDPLAMASILRATGPVSFDRITVSGDTVANFVMRDEYRLFSGSREAQRKTVLADLAGALYDGVTKGAGSASGLARALAEAGTGGHLQVWSAHAQEQKVLAPLRASGALPTTPGAFLEVVSNNASGNKADYYVRRRVAYERRGGNTARVQVTLTNIVDPSKVPAVVIGREGGPPAPEPGATRQIITLYVGVGQRVRSISVDGRPAQMEAGTERGHGWASVQVEIRPSRPTEITAAVQDPGGALTYRQQPLAVPDELALRVPHRLG